MGALKAWPPLGSLIVAASQGFLGPPDTGREGARTGDVDHSPVPVQVTRTGTACRRTGYTWYKELLRVLPFRQRLALAVPFVERLTLAVPFFARNQGFPTGTVGTGNS